MQLAHCMRVIQRLSASDPHAHIGASAYGKDGYDTHITLPRSRKRAPGLQILIDSSRHLRAVRMSR